MSYVSNWLPTKRNRLSENVAITKVMADAFRNGYNVKQIAGYFRVGLPFVYKKIPVKKLKQKAENL